MKKINKNLLLISLGVSSLLVVAPSILTSCSTNEVKESNNPKQIIDFSKYMNGVYKQQSNSSINPFVPVYEGQEIYQFKYKLKTSEWNETLFNDFKREFKTEEIKVNETTYNINVNFRNENLLRKMCLGLVFDLEKESWKVPQLNGTNEISFDVVSNQNLESKIKISKTTKDIVWYVYPKEGKSWNNIHKGGENALFSIYIESKWEEKN